MQTDTSPLPTPPSARPLQTPEQAAELQRIVEAQGKVGKSTLENLEGSCADLWDSDEEFEAFLTWLRRRRGKE